MIECVQALPYSGIIFCAASNGISHTPAEAITPETADSRARAAGDGAERGQAPAIPVD